MLNAITAYGFGPTVYQMFVHGNAGYKHHPLEFVGTHLVSISVGCRTAIFTLVPILWVCGMMSSPSALSWLNWLFCFTAAAYITRTCGRLMRLGPLLASNNF